MSISLTIQMLGPADTALLDNVAPGVFDNAIDQRWTAEFLADPRHHMAVAIDDGQVVDNTAARRLYAAVGGNEQPMVYVTFEL